MKASELLTVLESVAPGLAAKELLQQGTSFIFTGGRVYTYNDEVSVSRDAAGIEVEGAVRSDELLKLLRRLGDKEVTLTVSKDDAVEAGELLIKAGRTKAGIRLEHEVQLPVAEVGAPKKWRKLPKDFHAALAFCLFCVSNDLTQPVLCCVHVKDNYVQACDNFRAVRRTMSSSMPKKVDELLVPGSVASDLAGYEVEAVGHTNEWTHFRCIGGVQFSYRRLQEDYPDLDKLFAVKGNKLTFPKHVPEVVERASVFSRAEIAMDEHIEVQVKDGSMQVYGVGDVGWLKERVSCKYKGKAFSFIVHPQHLVEMLAHTQEATVGRDSISMVGEDFIYMASLSAEE